MDKDATMSHPATEPQPMDTVTPARAFEQLLEERRRVIAHADRQAVVDEMRWYQRINALLQRHLNLLAEQAYEGRHPKHWLWRSHKQFILDRLSPGDRVLDVGCGASAYLLWMAEMGCRVTGCDIRRDRIDLAESIMSHKNLTFQVLDVVADPPTDQYDVVICSHLLEHLDDPVLLLHSLLPVAPRLIAAVPPLDNTWQKVMFRDLGLEWMDDADHEREYTPALLREQIESAGWRVDELVAGVDIKALATRAGG